MSADFVAVVASVVGVVGTLGGAALTQRASNRGKRMELEARRAEADVQAHTADRAERQALYSDLNSTARTYRTAVQDLAMGLLVDEEKPIARLDAGLLNEMRAARTAYCTVYARAQMLLAEPTLEVASEVNRCLGYGYAIVQQFVSLLSSSPDLARRPSSIQTLHNAVEWFDGPCSNAVWLLRRALRAELGVTELPETFSFNAEIGRLRAARQAETAQRELRENDCPPGGRTAARMAVSTGSDPNGP